MMMPALFPRQSNSIIARPTGVSASLAVQSPLTRYGDRIRNQIERGLTLRLNHRTREGRMFCPRIISSLLFTDRGAPALHAVVVDPETLFHYRMETFTDPNFLRALALTVGRRVFVYQRTAQAGDPMPSGIWFVTPLRDVADASARRVELPKRVTLDVARRPSHLHVPIGVTVDKPDGLWLPLAAMDSVLIGGERGMGKSNMVHAFIAALAAGQAAQMVLFDGKGGLEFNRYRGLPGVTVAEDLTAELKKLHDEMQRRMESLLRAGVVNVSQYPGAMPRVAVVIDELWYVMKDKATAELLIDLAARGRCVGIHPIGATNQCRAEVVTPNLKVNLHTRIAFSVPQQSDSRVILDASDAAALPNIPGRCVIRWQARMLTAQAFEVILPPAPSDLPIRTTPGLRLSDQERQVVAWAMDAGRGDDRGYVTLAVWQQFGTGYQEAKRRLADWRARGWLVKDGKHKNSHRLAGELLSVWQSGKFGEFSSLAVGTPKPPPYQTRQTDKHPARLLDVDDAAFLAEIQPRLNELTASGLSAQAAYERFLSENA
jgi:hypothetical protein